MSKRDYYDVLSVSRDASERDIKKAYKRLAMKYHPDKNAGDANAEAKFKEIKEAYEILTDTEKRRQFDEFGHQAFEQGGYGRQGSHAGAGFGGRGYEDIFGGAFGQRSRGFGGTGGFDDIFSQARAGRARSQKGQDQEFTLTVDFIDTIQGAKKTVELPINGVQKTISVNVPAGIKEGEKIRYAGKGCVGVHGGPAGDLLLTIATRPHAFLEREGNDLICTVKVDIATAALGGETEVSVLDSQFKLKIPAGTQTGRKFKLRGKGVTDRKGATGDLLIKALVETPTKLTDQQRELLEAFRASL
jgi:molecular chaperone DnaJ